MKRLTKLKEKAIKLASQPALSFYELATTLCELHDEDLSHLKDIPIGNGKWQRKKYYLLQVGGLIREHKISKAEAEAVGWTKLQIIARHLNSGEGRPECLHQYMEMAKKPQARSRWLADELAGNKVPEDQAVQFNLDEKAKAELEEALTAFGAEQAPRGLVNREGALLKMVRAAMANEDWG